VGIHPRDNPAGHRLRNRFGFMSRMRCSTISTNCSPVSGNLHRRVPLEEWPEFRLVAWWTMKKTYTDKQGQYLAFIYYYSKIHGCSPSEAEMKQYFRVSPTRCTSDDRNARGARLHHANARASSVHPSLDLA
jgi:hypothetical protein